ncbi:MAG: ATP-dependent metallopeptidase FtsH/Yme1/Tma family protein [Chloroflexi bacterium]|nr:ATP-dependent metallopeptidase FtsH/Yme1/Tma family protein [Chloroflexota bacterium]
MDEQQRRKMGFTFIYLLIALAIVWLFQSLVFQPFIRRWQEVPYSKFRQDLADGRVAEVTVGQDRIYYICCDQEGKPDTNKVYNVVRVEDPELINDLLAANVTFKGEVPANSFWSTLLSWLIPLIPFALIYYFLFQRISQEDAPGVMSMGKSRARQIPGEITGIKFADVGGLEEVEVELREIIQFLKSPQRFTRLGAKLPKGVLLVGPPGTGKTLLARATAGEAGVPFFLISGSDFVEMFVGVGAARVRDMFEQAKRKAPCIVFIDELDAIGQSRSGAGSLISNEEREQTLNQLLAEMDGFEPNQGVVIMAATNRPDVLDKALLRPGRFDRQIEVPLPTERGRLEILGIHTRKMPLAEDVNLERLAQVTSGFSGADLANMANEAALMAARRSSERISMADFELAIERIVTGLQRKTPLSQEVRRRVAYHEGGHALVAALLPHTDPVHKVSIIPTGRGALGYTMQMPEEDQYLLSEEELRERLAVMLGGRAAELLIYQGLSTGAANDLEKATELANRMVTEFGMTEVLGPVRYITGSTTEYLGGRRDLRPEVAPETASLINAEVRRLIEEAEDRAIEILRAHRAALDRIAEVLQRHEVIGGDQIREIAATEPVAA